MLLFLVACSNSPAENPAKAEAAATAPAAPSAAPLPEGNPANNLGAPVDVSAALPVDKVVAEAATWSGKQVTLTGKVHEVCQKKGCWHTIATSDPNVDVMVKDKEYKIFLPFDSAGKTATVSGTFSVETVPLEEARHYAEDAGKDPATITEAPKTFLMDADGIVLSG